MKKKAKKTKVTARKKVKKSTRKVARKKTSAKKAKAKKVSKKPSATKAQKKAGPKIDGTLIGHVTHYFSHVTAAVIQIDKGEIVLGDNLLFKGHTTNFKQTVTSMQIDRAPIQKARAGDEIGVQVKSRVREHDAVYRLR